MSAARSCRFLIGFTLIAAFLGVPVVAAVAAPAAQTVFAVIDEPFPWKFTDPCTGVEVHGTAIENGVVRLTDLGEQGSHWRVRVGGTASLFDADNNLVGTWTYRQVYTDQMPPGEQGAAHFTASGRVTYVGGGSAILHVFYHRVFDKGGDEKFPARSTAACGGSARTG
jgi:hypothetical protein